MQLSTPVGQIAGVGPIFQKKLKKLGIKDVQGLIFHFPHRYEDFSNVTPISRINLNGDCCIAGKILGIENIQTWKKKMILTEAVVQDGTGAIKAVWFRQPYLTKVLKKGDSVYLTGKTSLGRQGLYLSNPAYEKTGGIAPVYPETEGLSSKWLRYIIKPVLTDLMNSIKDPLPENLIREYQLLPFSKAIWQVHFPDSLESAKKAKERFSFEELFFIELWVLRERAKLSQEKAAAIPINLGKLQKLVKSLPFKLTDAQKKSAWAILKDLEKPRPMNRLLEGDVGSGKTVVAALAILNAIKAGYQAAFMAPTEILANQHFKTIWDILQNFNINVGLLTGKTDKFYSRKLKNDSIEISRRKLLEKTLQGEMNLVIGTHALIQDKVKFGKLALVVIDEQHRFGVEQRARLCQPCGHPTSANRADVGCPPKTIPHLLSMTATPIPRTLALTIYGDLDLSLINQLPKGRKKIITKIIPPEERNKAYDFIREEAKNGRQTFVICPRIESGTKRLGLLEETESQSPWANVKAVKAEYEKLSKEVFPDLRVAMLHGKLPGSEKERTMSAFAKGYGGLKRDSKNKIDILVSTSMVEVGVDIPNATVMLIEGADRFGLAQLHQFRGRVGRSIYQSYCFLMADSPSQKTNLRLKALVNCENSFELAEKDLAIRGPGDFSGQRQWGIPDLIMDSLKDVFLVEKTRSAAKEILTQDPLLKTYPLLQERLEKFRERIHLE